MQFGCDESIHRYLTLKVGRILLHRPCFIEGADESCLIGWSRKIWSELLYNRLSVNQHEV